MKAIIENNKTYKVTGEKGDFTICEDSKGKCKMFQTSKVEIVEIESIQKSKYSHSKTKKLNPANFMSKEEFAKSKYATMSNEDFDEERRMDMWTSKSL